jgi:hypothetical protein
MTPTSVIDTQEEFFMSDISSAAIAAERELFEQIDGVDRIEKLPLAHFLTIAPAAVRDAPVYVSISWTPDLVEAPTPGSALWRTVLIHRLEAPVSDDPADRVLRSQIEQSLHRFPSLEAWWSWIRTGWIAPPRRPDRRDLNTAGDIGVSGTGWPW